MKNARNLMLAVVMCFVTSGSIGLLAGGCLPVTATDYDRLYAAKQAYQTSGTVFEAAIDNGLIKTQQEARPIQAARDAAKAVLDDADAKLKAGDKLGFGFALDEFNVALGKFRQYLARSNVEGPAAPVAAPTPAPVAPPVPVAPGSD